MAEPESVYATPELRAWEEAWERLCLTMSAKTMPLELAEVIRDIAEDMCQTAYDNVRDIRIYGQLD